MAWLLLVLAIIRYDDKCYVSASLSRCIAFLYPKQFGVLSYKDSYYFDFHDYHERFKDKIMLDEFVENYINLLTKEIQSIMRGKSILDVYDYKWENKQFEDKLS